MYDDDARVMHHRDDSHDLAVLQAAVGMAYDAVLAITYGSDTERPEVVAGLHDQAAQLLRTLARIEDLLGLRLEFRHEQRDRLKSTAPVAD